MSADKKLLKALQNIREEFARNAKRQQAYRERQKNGGFFRRLGRMVGIYDEPDRLIPYQSEQDQKSKLDAEMVLWTRAVARYTRALVLVGVVGGVVAAGTGFVIKGQLDEMRDEQRAWMGHPRINVVNLDVKDGRAILGFDISFENVGHTPTRGATIDAAMVPLKEGSPESGDWHKTQDTSCKIPISLGNDKYAVTPGDKFALIPSYPSLALDIGTRKEFFAVVTGCIFYGILADDKIHRTGFVSTVVYRKLGNPIQADKMPVPVSELQVITYAAGYSD